MYKQRFVDRRTGKPKERWVQTYTDESGRRRYRTAGTRSALRAKLARIQAQASKPPVSPLLLGDCLDAEIDRLRHAMRPGSLHVYRQHAKLYLKPLLGHIRVSDLGVGDVSAALVTLADRGLAPATVIQARATLVQILQVLVTRGELARNVASLARSPRRHTPEMKTWTRDETHRFLVHVQRHELEALFVLALVRGLRIGELLGLQWPRLDFATKTLRVDASLQKIRGLGLVLTEPKTPKSTRTMHLPPICEEVVSRHREAQRIQRMAAGPRWKERNLVFASALGGPTWPSEVRRKFHLLHIEAGVPAIRFHDLRHTCATLMLEDGINPRVVQEILGHADVAITLRIYSHVKPETERDASTRLERKIFG